MSIDELREFDTFSAAFDFCREMSKPVSVIIAKRGYKLFPSGRAERRASLDKTPNSDEGIIP